MRCSNDDCENKLLLDGEEIGVINMKRYLIAHEVLRDYMYQFLFARLVRPTIFLMMLLKALFKYMNLHYLTKLNESFVLL